MKKFLGFLLLLTLLWPAQIAWAGLPSPDEDCWDCWDDEVANYTYTFPAGWNMVSIPVYLESNDWQDIWIEDGCNNMIPMDRLYTWDEDRQKYMKIGSDCDDCFNYYDPNEAYWMYFDHDTTVTFHGEARYDSADYQLMRGWNLVPYPFMASRDGQSMEFYNAATGETKSFDEARNCGWVKKMKTWDNGSYRSVSDYGLMPWHSYWICVNCDDISMRFIY